jgi:hypothetical protein
MIRETRGNRERSEIVNVHINRRVYPALIQDGDTIVIANINNVQISSPKAFNTHKDYLTYLKYRKYAAIVYPYAKEAVRIFNEADRATIEMRKRKRKKYMKTLTHELQDKFEEPLKGLSKTQGKIMIKMIEREMGRPMFDLVKETNGRWKAAYWNQSSKLYGYRLKEGYVFGQRPILDIVLMDFDISYDLSEKY